MALQGESKKLYHREYMRRRRAGLPTRGVVKPKVMEQWCSECVLPPSPERIVVSFGSGYRLCQCCYAADAIKSTATIRDNLMTHSPTITVELGS